MAGVLPQSQRQTSPEAIRISRDHDHTVLGVKKLEKLLPGKKCLCVTAKPLKSRTLDFSILIIVVVNEVMNKVAHVLVCLN